MPQLTITDIDDPAPAAASEDGVLSIPITTEIGGWGFGLNDLLSYLRGFKGSRIDVPINSFGGELFEGLAMYNTLKGRAEPVTTRVIGYAVSMGSILLMAGSRREIPKQGFVMIHNPFMMSYGDAKETASVSALLETMTNTLAEIYQEVTGLDRKRILSMMNAETWLSASEALALGFVTDIVDGAVINASFNPGQLENYQNVPAALLEKTNPPMNFNEKLISAINSLADRLEGSAAPSSDTQNKVIAPNNVEGQSTEGPPADDSAEADMPAAETTEATVPATPEAPTEEEGEGESALVTLLEKLTTQQEALIQRIERVEQSVTAVAASAKATAKAVGQGQGNGMQVASRTQGAPDGSKTERAFRQKASALRPNNKVEH